MSKKNVVIKISGKVLENEELTEILLQEIKKYINDFSFYILHGGGIFITEMYNKLNIETKFVEGLRYTSDEMMDVVEMVLSGKINKQLVSLALKNGIKAIGISGRDNLFLAKKKLKNGKDLGRVGEIVKVNTALIDSLTKEGYLVFISPVSNDENYKALNINADNAAEALAIELKADLLLMLSDVEGLLDKDSQIIETLSEEESEKLIKENVITGGMIVKIRSTFEVLKKGVKEVIITNVKRGLLDSIFKNEKIRATRIKL